MANPKLPKRDLLTGVGGSIDFLNRTGTASVASRLALHRRRDRITLLAAVRPTLGVRGSFIDAGLASVLRALGSSDFVSYLTGADGPLHDCESVPVTECVRGAECRRVAHMGADKANRCVLAISR